MKEFDALIFDCDGVLVNSEEIIQDIELELLAGHGLHYDRDEFSRRFLGVSNEHFHTELSADSMAELGKPLAHSFFDELKERALAAYQTELRAFEGILPVLEAWHGVLAVASSSSVEGLEYKLQLTGLEEHFLPHVYSAEKVGAGKPDPAIYLHAAEKLNVSTTACVVVEDSVNGVLAAKAAGMHTIGFTAGAHCRQGHEALLIEAGADLVVRSMAEIAERVS